MAERRRKRRSQMKTWGANGEVAVGGRRHTCFKRIPVPCVGTRLRARASVCPSAAAESSSLSGRLFRDRGRTEAFSIQAHRRRKQRIQFHSIEGQTLSAACRGHTLLKHTHTHVFVFERTDARVRTPGCYVSLQLIPAAPATSSASSFSS